jgi:hypothetical protein
MPLNVAMSAMSAAEVVLWAALAILFLSKGLTRRFPAMGYYLALRAISTPALMLFLYLDTKPWARDMHAGQIYYFGFFATYLRAQSFCFSSALKSSARRWRRSLESRSWRL